MLGSLGSLLNPVSRPKSETQTPLKQPLLTLNSTPYSAKFRGSGFLLGGSVLKKILTFWHCPPFFFVMYGVEPSRLERLQRQTAPQISFGRVSLPYHKTYKELMITCHLEHSPKAAQAAMGHFQTLNPGPRAVLSRLRHSLHSSRFELQTV